MSILSFRHRRIIEKEDLLKLRDYLRKAIKEIHRLDKGKDEITDLLDSNGFGEKIEQSLPNQK
jgi:hypothetical protein